MAITLEKNAEKYLVDSIKRFFADIQQKASDLGGGRYEPELHFWKK